jgi:hypothetical protein
MVQKLGARQVVGRGMAAIFYFGHNKPTRTLMQSASNSRKEPVISYD